MTREGYTPYCGNDIPRFEIGGCDNPRTKFNGEQFVCPRCGFISGFPIEFITRYKEKWNIDSFCKCTEEPCWGVGGKCVTCGLKINKN